MTGAYIDPERGALKVTDVSPEDYPAALSFLQEKTSGGIFGMIFFNIGVRKILPEVL